MLKKERHPLLWGTMLLTVTGLITRIIGFFYRIYLSQLFGEEGMGIYQLVNPVLALSFSLTAAGYQTSISKLVAEQSARQKRSTLRPLFIGLGISLPQSLLCSGFVFLGAEFIGTQLLGESRTIPLLRILAFSLPLSTIHSCINGYFYGMKKTAVPAASQLLEQLTRVCCVYGITVFSLSKKTAPDISVAVTGLVLGELISLFTGAAAIYAVLTKKPGHSHAPSLTEVFSDCRSLLSMALPLTANRIVLNLLQSAETVAIPTKLQQYGYDPSSALSIYGVLTGMALPLIFFPNAITGSVSVLLLPLISENYALKNLTAVKTAVLRTVRYCLLLGFTCMIIFVLSGSLIGEKIFNSTLAGHFITTLGFICPFIYLDTTLSSILQGLGLAGHIFIINVICLLLRLGFVFFAVPIIGITGYLWGLLAGQLLQSLLYLLTLYRFYQKQPTA